MKVQMKHPPPFFSTYTSVQKLNSVTLNKSLCHKKIVSQERCFCPFPVPVELYVCFSFKEGAFSYYVFFRV